MKRTLLATTALAAVGVLAAAQPASAAEKLQVEVGGYMNQWFGYAENDDSDLSNFDQKHDTEIHFTGSTTLDNGIEFGINVQLEGSTEADQIDESYLFVEGTFGRVLLGQENSAHYLMHYAPVNYAVGTNESSDGVFDWIPNTTGSNNFDGCMVSTFCRAGDNDSNKITYFTPRFAGFQFGASYIPEFDKGDDQPDDSLYNNGLSFGLNYDQKFGDIRAQASLGYMTANAPDGGDDDLEMGNIGLRLGFGAFTAAASAARIFEGDGVFDQETFVWTAGLAWAQGPLGVSAQYFTSEGDDPAGGEDEYEAIVLSSKYTLAPGINAVGSVFMADWKAGAGGDDNDGYGVVGGLQLTF